MSLNTYWVYFQIEIIIINILIINKVYFLMIFQHIPNFNSYAIIKTKGKKCRLHLTYLF